MGILSKIKARYERDKAAYKGIAVQEKQTYYKEKEGLKEASRNKYYGELRDIKLGTAKRRARFYQRFREPQNYFSTGRDIIGGLSSNKVFGGFDIITGKYYGAARKRYKRKRKR